MTIRQLLYVSRAEPGIGDADVREILALSKRNNWRLDLTGCLLFSGRHFAQTLEGRPEHLDPLLGRIKADERHTDVIVLRDHVVKHRLHGGWSMAYLYRMDLVDELEALLSGKPFTSEDAEFLMRNAAPDSVMGSF